MLGAEPYISGNVGSGTVEELAKWVEYMTSDGDTPMAKLRRKNGREKSWNVKYLGVGNESWGCGGNMRPEYYSDLFRRYSTYCRNYDNHHLYKIASGASDYDYNWTKVLMDRVGDRMAGLSLHYYTVKDWSNNKGSATNFDDQEYFWTISKALQIEDVIKKHCAIMDQKDPDKRIGLLVDEWGTWWDEEPGTIRGHLYQQNSMRDAMVAALSLNVFQRHTDRIKMANIAYRDQLKGNTQLNWDYKEFTRMGSIAFPSNMGIALTTPESEIKLGIRLNYLKNESDWATRTKVSDKYREVTVDQILRRFMAL